MAEKGASPSRQLARGKPVCLAFDRASLTASRHLITAAGPASSNLVPVLVLEPITGTQLEIELTNACVLRLEGVIAPVGSAHPRNGSPI